MPMEMIAEGFIAAGVVVHCVRANEIYKGWQFFESCLGGGVVCEVRSRRVPKVGSNQITNFGRNTRWVVGWTREKMRGRSQCPRISSLRSLFVRGDALTSRVPREELSVVSRIDFVPRFVPRH